MGTGLGKREPAGQTRALKKERKKLGDSKGQWAEIPGELLLTSCWTGRETAVAETTLDFTDGNNIAVSPVSSSSFFV